MTKCDLLLYEDNRVRSVNALKVAYRGEQSTEIEDRLTEVCREGTLCCTRYEYGCGYLTFEYEYHHVATSAMRKLSQVPRVISVVLSPDGFACDNCKLKPMT